MMGLLQAYAIVVMMTALSISDVSVPIGIALIVFNAILGLIIAYAVWRAPREPRGGII